MGIVIEYIDVPLLTMEKFVAGSGEEDGRWVGKSGGYGGRS